MTQLYLTMPQPGETITEGTIVAWKVKPGDVVEETDELAQLETEKAVFDYESPFQGRIVKLLHTNGARVKVAHPIAVIDCPPEKVKVYQMMGIAKLVGESAAWEPFSPQHVPPVPPEKIVPQTSQGVAQFPVGELRMSPIVRRLAGQHGLSEGELKELARQDPQGRVTKEAIEKLVAQKKSPVLEANANVKACSAIRMRIAENMVRSKTKIPHAHTGLAVDMTHVVEYREQNKKRFSELNGTSLNLLSLVCPALVSSIQKFPMVNASYDDSAEPHRIRYFKNINLGVAVGTEHGLIIPVLHDAGSLDFNDFNSRLNDLIARTQNQKLKPAELMNGTLIFNNFGYFGTSFGVQIIGYPNSATLGMGAIEDRVVPVKGEIKIRKMCDFVLSFDHRVMDGRESGLFLSALKKEIEALRFEHVGFGGAL